MRNEIRTIIFSKNRACQLELLLRNMTLPATVLFTSDEQFWAGYVKVIRMYPNIEFIHERENFKGQLLSLMDTEYVLFFCDDDIIIRPLDFKDRFEQFKGNPNFICLCLRLDASYREEGFVVNNEWRWRGHKRSWGYPMSVSSHIFRTHDIKPVMEREPFKNPSELELLLLHNPPPRRKWMLCVDKAMVVNSRLNTIQTQFRSISQRVPIEYLEDEFTSGLRIAIEPIKQAAVGLNTTFVTVPLEFEPHG
jgi:hypothetical protein